ncbi:RNA polymerase sigma factor [Actinomadura rudentiformis]|uniref:RNA polymerase sigma factor n=1 Tax=Actinomadura rudentiformis TaxID=359158 RepID=A0A6H9YYF6_9ACTN|nr:RNA polymerase sigma factor [Actinomadura rudentiformis]KAB2346370.1 RNA polymerase sigma factor [Actinomadura rudentiformis]
MTLEPPTDTELWDRARDGDDHAFGELFDRHSRTVYNYCFRRTADWTAAEDLTSVVFLETWRRRDQVRLSADSLLPWLYGVATNVLHNHRRSLRRHRAALDRVRAMPAAPNDAAAAAARLEAEREMRVVLDSIKKLSRGDQEILALCVWEGLGYAEAAAALGVPVGTVRSRLARARKRLRHDTEPHRADGHRRGDRPTALFSEETS